MQGIDINDIPADDGDDGIDKLAALPIKALAGMKPKDERKKEKAAPI